MTAEEWAKWLQDEKIVPRLLLSEAGSFNPIQKVAEVIRAVVGDEREACALVADGYGAGDVSFEESTHASRAIAAAIRARGEPRPQLSGVRTTIPYDPQDANWSPEAEYRRERGIAEIKPDWVQKLSPKQHEALLRILKRHREEAVAFFREQGVLAEDDPQPDAIAEPSRPPGAFEPPELGTKPQLRGARAMLAKAYPVPDEGIRFRDEVIDETWTRADFLRILQWMMRHRENKHLGLELSPAEVALGREPSHDV